MAMWCFCVIIVMKGAPLGWVQLQNWNCNGSACFFLFYSGGGGMEKYIQSWWKVCAVCVYFIYTYLFINIYTCIFTDIWPIWNSAGDVTKRKIKRMQCLKFRLQEMQCVLSVQIVAYLDLSWATGTSIDICMYIYILILSWEPKGTPPPCHVYPQEIRPY